MAKVYQMEGQIVDNDEDTLNDPMLEQQTSLSSFVLWKIREWEDFVESNFYSQWDEYYRLWRGLWAQEDQTRSTERSRIVTPALQQAVESSVSDIEEATFGHGHMFDIEDNVADEEQLDMVVLRDRLREEFQRRKIRSSVSEVLINAAVYGTGAAEVVLEEVDDLAPATQPMMDGMATAIGVNKTKRTVVKMKPIQMRNFRIDPVATSIESAEGVATDEFVPMHYVEELQRKGIYRDVHVGPAAQDHDIEPNPELDTVPYTNKVRLMKYWGLVPTHLLRAAQGADMKEDEVLVSLSDEEESEESYWTEAIVVIANQGVLLKAEENPYMMQDRPIVAFQWDVVPGLFWGRGICEKGYNSQKALDAEIRARIDALALTTHPMLAMDATRIPRGHQPTVRPGKMLLTQGPPREVVEAFNLGNVDQITFAQAGELQNMVQQATGAVDGAALAQSMGSNNKTGAVSMALGPLIKRQKRTLLNFQECFWLPFVEKAAWRYMQFDPENFPVKDFNFVPQSSLNIMAREYEVSQLVQLMQTMGDQSPLYPIVVESVIEHMDVSNREKLIAQLKEASKPDPQQQALQQKKLEMEIGLQQAQIDAVNAQAAESNARAQKYTVEAQLEPQKLEIEKLDHVADVRDGVTTREFQQRLDIANVKLQERKLDIEERKVNADAAANLELDRALAGESEDS